MSMSLRARRRALMSAQETERTETFPTAPKYYRLDSSGITTDGGSCQGCCYVTIGDYTYLYFMTRKSDHSAQYLYRYCLNDGTTTKMADYTTLYHANSLTYIPSSNEIYVGTADTSIGIGVIDLTDHSISRYFQIHDAENNAVMPWGIAYDRTHDVLYSIYGYTHVMVYQTDGTYLRKIDFVNYPAHADGSAQSIETDGEYIYFSFYDPNVIDVYKLDGTFVKQQTMGFDKELEEIAYDWNGRFYANVYLGSYKTALYALLLRTFDFNFNMVYTPQSVWKTNASGGSVGRWGNNAFTFKSTSSASWNINVYGAGYPFSFSEIKDKNCKISIDIKRVAGSSGNIYVSLFTANSQAVTSGSGVIYHNEKTFTIPTGSNWEHFEYDFVPGSTFLTPAQAEEGTYVGYRVFLYAASGNTCYVKNIKIDVEA